ncbi:MAG: gliding motility-associated ABC transporter permease subunit GldF, partial [Proteobacteria bacterium]
YYITQLGIAAHYSSISKGLIDLRDVLYFLTIIALMILSTKLVLESRKW